MSSSGNLATDSLSILFLARSLEVGGAERQLVHLAKELKDRGHRVRIALFYRRGSLLDDAECAGIEVLDLGKKGRWDTLGFLARTVAAVRRTRPDIIFGILGGPNIVAAVAKPFAGSAGVVWTVLNSDYDPSVDHWLARFGYRIEAALARLPDAIIANSAAGRAFALSRRFPPDRVAVVPNGIDTDRFRPDRTLRAEQRRNLGLGDDVIAVGVLARLNSTKGYPTFLRAAAKVGRAAKRMRFLCVGSGPELNPLRDLAGELGIADRVIFTGELDAVAALNAFDIACSPSLTEGFSNAIAEAMSCGLPCIVTDVGDSAAIVGDAGAVVPPGSPDALAAAIQAQIASLDEHDPASSRQRIVDNFSVGTMVERTLKVFHSVVGSAR